MADDHAGPPSAADKTKPASAPADNAGKKESRRRLFGFLGLGLVAVAILYGLYYVLVASHFVSTDDATSAPT